MLTSTDSGSPKTGRPREPRILEVRKGLLDTRIEESSIEARRLLEIGDNDIDVSQRIEGEHARRIRVLNGLRGFTSRRT